MRNGLLKTIKIYKFQQFIFKLFAQTEYLLYLCSVFNKGMSLDKKSEI